MQKPVDKHLRDGRQRQRIEAAFAARGLRAAVQPLGYPEYAETDDAVHVRIAADRLGEYLDVRYQPHLPVQLAALLPSRDGQIVLVADDGVTTQRFVCGRSGGRYFVRPEKSKEPGLLAV